jgi:hypothetical protein
MLPEGEPERLEALRWDRILRCSAGGPGASFTTNNKLLSRTRWRWPRASKVSAVTEVAAQFLPAAGNK